MPLDLLYPNLISEPIQRQMLPRYIPSEKNSPRQGEGQSEEECNQPPEVPGRPTALSVMNGNGVHQENRRLPARDVTDENLDDTYVDFIMYCNPTISLDTDTMELRKIFRTPPKSDGKSFNTYKLFELIRMLEQKEIKTWAQLALDLGVEQPELGKRQSAQKVQQYAVRLKRWMHAMHVDAFFEFLLDKAHVYWTQVPSIHEPTSDFGRDGVPPEEDLALRALLPETRPKRGRRKAEDREDRDIGKSPYQRPRLDSPVLSEDFLITRASPIANNTTPATSHPGFPNFQDRMVSWSATEMGAAAATFRWPPVQEHLQTPLSAYPQSALTPRTQLWNDVNEPRSAITPKSRARRRHGPAVSSAWPSNGSTSAGKLRGRPPSNRSTTDGPFSMFPANPVLRNVPTMHLIDDTSSATPILADSQKPLFFPAEARADPPNPPPVGSRPNRLQLQVPERQGGAVVRLATPPPPMVLVNGECSTQQGLSPTAGHNVKPLMEFFNTPGEQGSNLEDSTSISFRQNVEANRTNIDALESHFISEILAADWYDAAGESIERCGIDDADRICKQVIKNLQLESSSAKTFLINLSILAGGPLMTRLRMTRVDQESVAHYECQRKMRFGSIEGNFTTQATIHRAVESAALEHGPEESEFLWKKRYLDLQQQIKERDERVGKLKRSVLDALLASS